MSLNTQQLSPEMAFVLYCSQTQVPENKKVILKDISSYISHWQEVFYLSVYHRTAGFIYFHLWREKSLQGIVPADIATQLKDYFLANTARNLRLWNEFSAIADRFQKYNIGLIPLKGILLAQLIYPHPGIRTIFSDIDLLTRSGDFQKVFNVLKMLGYTYEPSIVRKEVLGRVFRKDNLKIDLHHHLYSQPWLNRIDTGRLWERSKVITLNDRRITTLSIEDICLALTVQIRCYISNIGLFRLSDFNELLIRYRDDFDWEYILWAARRYCLLGQLFFSLYLCQELFFSSLPDDLLKRISSRRLRIKLLPLASRGIIEKILLANSRVSIWQDWPLKILMTDKLIDSLRIFVHRYLNIPASPKDLPQGSQGPGK